MLSAANFMDLKDLRKNWNLFGKTDALYAILTRDWKEKGRWNIDDFFATGEEEIKEIMNSISSRQLLKSHKKALDFGCGVGRLTQPLCHYFDEVHGVDIAASMVERANQYNKHKDKCFYHVNEKEDLSIFPGESFDFIYTCITLQHMHPVYAKKYIREFIRLLAPAGIVIFQIPQAPYAFGAPVTRREKIKRSIPPFILKIYHHIRYGGTRPVMQTYGIPKHEVLDLLRECGAKVVEVEESAMIIKDWISVCYSAQKI